MNDIYQQLGAQLSQRGQQGQGQGGNPYASLMQQRQPQMQQQAQGGYGGAAGNPYANIFQALGQQARMPSASSQYGSQSQGAGLLSQLGLSSPTGGGLLSRLGLSPGGSSSGYQMPAPDQRNQYASIPQAALDGTGWKNGINPQMFQQQNPYYGQTGYYGNLQQVQQQMAGKAQSAGIPQGVLGASTYTQNPAGQTPWVPDLTPQQKVDQDLASWEANRWNPK